MDIKTKFTPGQPVWHIHNDTVKCSRIDGLHVSVFARPDGVVEANPPVYRLIIKGPMCDDFSIAPAAEGKGTSTEEAYEHRVFATKADLIASL